MSIPQTYANAIAEPQQDNQKQLMTIPHHCQNVLCEYISGARYMSAHDTVLVHLVSAMLLTFHLITIQSTDIPTLQHMAIIFTMSSNRNLLQQ